MSNFAEQPRYSTEHLEQQPLRHLHVVRAVENVERVMRNIHGESVVPPVPISLVEEIRIPAEMPDQQPLNPVVARLVQDEAAGIALIRQEIERAHGLSEAA